MTIEPPLKGTRLYTIYNTHRSWVVKVATVMPNHLFEEAIFEFWTFDAAHHFVKAKQEEVF